MNLIIAGSRDHDDNLSRSAIHDWLSENVDRDEVDRVITGGARGADKAGERWAQAHSLRVMVYAADWDKHGNSAGMRRNEAMAKDGDTLIAFPLAWSRGTKHMIQEAKKEGLDVTIVETKELFG